MQELMLNSRHCDDAETQIGGGDEAKLIAQGINYILSGLSAFKSGTTHTPDNYNIHCSSPSTRLYV